MKISKDDLALAVFVILFAGYFVWHLGRAYEFDQAKAVISDFTGKSQYLDYMVPETDAERQTGKLRMTNCYLNTDVHTLLDYTGLDY